MNRITISRKSEAGDWILWTVRIFLTFLVISFIVFQLNTAIKSNLDIKELRFYTFAERILYSSDCFVLQNDLKTYPGIFDYNKLSEEQLHNCFTEYEDESVLIADVRGIKKDLGSKISIFYNGENLDLFYNRDYYEDAKVLTFSNFYELVSKQYFILINKENELIPGNVVIEVVWKK